MSETSRLIQSQQVESINAFIVDTSVLTARQLHWLAFMKDWVSPEIHAALDSGIETTIRENIELLATISREVTAAGVTLVVPQSTDDKPLPIRGFGYSTKSLGYEVCVFNPGPVTVPLTGHVQIG